MRWRADDSGWSSIGFCHRPEVGANGTRIRNGAEGGRRFALPKGEGQGEGEEGVGVCEWSLHIRDEPKVPARELIFDFPPGPAAL